MDSLWGNLYWSFRRWPAWLSLPLRLVLFALAGLVMAIGQLFRFYSRRPYDRPSWHGIICRIVVISLLIAGMWYVWHRRSGLPVPVKESDPVRDATELGMRIAEKEVQFRKVEDGLRNLLILLLDYPPKQDLERANVQHVRKMVVQLVGLAAVLRVSYEQVAASVQDLKDSYRIAPEVFRGASVLYQEWSEAASKEAIKTDYVMAATAWEDLARKAEQEGQWLDQAESDLPAALTGVREVEILLTRVQSFLNTYPSELRGEAERKALFRNIQQSMTKYQGMRNELEALLKKVEERKVEVRQPHAGEGRK